jgi:predicted transglutaminase-like cysteine proteinase
LRRAAISVLAALLLLCSVPREEAAARDGGTGLFGTREVFSADLAPFRKWDDVIARATRELDDPQAYCRTVQPGQDCVAGRWRSLVAALAALPLRERVRHVNAVLNRVPYVAAMANWHEPEHWESPFEFLAKGGQCEDYAIAKLLALEASGVSEDLLRLAVVRDTWRSADHAVAVVFVDGAALVLDNQSPEVAPAAARGRYVPYYSINRSGWWYHQPGALDRIASARSR